MGGQMEQAVNTDEKFCKIFGSPDFTCNKCKNCREGAEPAYTLCLTLRITDKESILNS
jgi:hypothetical protein